MLIRDLLFEIPSIAGFSKARFATMLLLGALLSSTAVGGGSSEVGLSTAASSVTVTPLRMMYKSVGSLRNIPACE